MSLLILGLCVIACSGFVALLWGNKPKLSSSLACAGVVAGAVLGLIPAITVLLNGAKESLRYDWSIPLGSFFIELDPVSALFLIPIFVLSALAAIYGTQYLRPYHQQKFLGAHWFFYNMLAASMAMVVLARNAVLFLIAWEVMSLASFFLVTFEHEEKQNREAGWTYLVAMHIGTAFLLAFFILLGSSTGSLDFDVIGNIAPSTANILFLLAVIGFGTKAGFMPMHVWLPEAHPAAPSHVSAVMSGVMIKTGIYGLVRTLILLGQPQEWWAWLLIAIGVSSGVLGVLFALAQHDLKRLLAYHSVENIGIITLGLGLGLLGLSTGLPALAVLGFAGGLFHVVNHAFFKGLLFLGAGSIAHATGTREIDSLGGLLKRMPWTGLTFLIGAVAISGLPPLNGFASEFLIYLGVFKNGITNGAQAVVLALCIIGGLALIGGLACACFTKAFGIIFLGEPRTEHARRAHEVAFAMRLPMLILAICCILIGLLSPYVIRYAAPVLTQATSLDSQVVAEEVADTSTVMWWFVAAAGLLIGLVVFLAVMRKWMLRGRTVRSAGTWDCGYAAPSPRMQYTASSFAQPLIYLFKPFLMTRSKPVSTKEYFPAESGFATETADVSLRYLFEPVFNWINKTLSRLHWLQHGRLQLYVLYIALTLLILLVWKMR
jgi:formate hydrogenlyase subunit 3/multisubunit Na+/H+ antiporter MnhD subunit